MMRGQSTWCFVGMVLTFKILKTDVIIGAIRCDSEMSAHDNLWRVHVKQKQAKLEEILE